MLLSFVQHAAYFYFLQGVRVRRVGPIGHFGRYAFIHTTNKEKSTRYFNSEDLTGLLWSNVVFLVHDFI